jgi:predicted dehydrogenase
MEKTATVYRKKPGFEEAAQKLRHASDARILLEMGRLAYGDLVQIETLKLGDEEPLRAELASFVRAVRENRVPEVPGEDGVRAVAVAEAVVAEIRKNLAARGITLEPPG